MELSVKIIALFLAILLTGLSAGFFYAWEVSVIPGTKQIPDKSYLEAMQAINRAILNPAFFVIFFGNLVFLLASSYLQYKSALDLSFFLILGATFSYLVGTFGVTVFGNVPLNEGLDVVTLEGLTTEAMNEIRTTYESKWNRWHIIRTVFSVLAFALSLLAVFTENHFDSFNS